MNFQGVRVTIMGLGRFGGGVGAARCLAGRGARVLVVDLADPETLRESLDALGDVPIEAFRFGPHRERDFTEADLVVANPAVRPDHPLLEAARGAGARVTTEIELLVEACPARIVGVTGTNGKSTTAAMTAHVLRAVRARERNEPAPRVWLGGNIGGSLLERVDRMGARDVVVLELSSFQLQAFRDSTRRPDVAVVTGCVPNHLNWHTGYAEYVAAKQRIFAPASENQRVVLAPRARELDTWRPLVRDRLVAPPGDEQLPRLGPPGRHNCRNALCAVAAAAAVLDCAPALLSDALATFTGLSMRLELIKQTGGVRYINDSAATTPESVAAALEAIDRSWLIAGGISKGAAIEPLAREVVDRARGAAFFGTVREELHAAVRSLDARLPCTAKETLAEAFAWCRRRAERGDAILLSPGFASLDQFVNYEERGRCFNRLVGR